MRGGASASLLQRLIDVLAYLLSLDVDANGPTGHNAESGVRQATETLNGIGPSSPTDPALSADLAVDGHRTVGASAMVAAEATTPVPDLVVSEQPGASPLTLQLRLLDAYLRQVRRAEAPLTLAVQRTRR